MLRKKQTTAADVPAITMESHAVLEALRSNMNLLGELASRTESPAEMPVINCPQDVYNLLGPEMSVLAQEQLRALLLDTKNHVLAQRVMYQGNVNSSVVRPAEVFRAAVMESVPSIIISHNQPSGYPTPSTGIPWTSTARCSLLFGPLFVRPRS